MKMTSPDFSQLPEVVWVKIMYELDLADRSRLARTCHTLKHLFNHPTIWSRITICMLTEQRLRKIMPVTVTEKPVQLVRRFGSYFQDLTFKLVGFVRAIPKECLEVLDELSKNSRLERLVLEVGTNSSHSTVSGARFLEPDHDDLTAFAALIRNSTRLKSFTLTFWPRFTEQPTLDILEELSNNPKVKQLEELSLYWLSATKGSWTLNNIRLPPSEQLLHLVEHFDNLVRLRLRSVMLTDDLVYALSKPNRRRLQSLSILVTYTSEEKASSIKTVSSEAWKMLCESSPAIKVDFTIMTRVPYMELTALLKSEIPLTSIHFMRHSRCIDSTLSHLASKYKETLRRFEDYTDSTNCDAFLLAMAQECRHMNCLVYNGTLKHTTLLSLAQLKGKDWQLFSFNIDNISTAVQKYNYNDDDDDDDVILKLTDGGKYSTPIMRNYEPEEDHLQVVEELTNKLSQLLGYRWRPFTGNSLN